MVSMLWCIFAIQKVTLTQLLFHLCRLPAICYHNLMDLYLSSPSVTDTSKFSSYGNFYFRAPSQYIIILNPFFKCSHHRSFCIKYIWVPLPCIRSCLKLLCIVINRQFLNWNRKSIHQRSICGQTTEWVEK